MLGFDTTGKPLRLSRDDRRSHIHVIGSSGSGKSKFLEWMIRGDLRGRQGFCLIDPHGTLYESVLNYCARKVLDRDIVLLDLSNPSQVVGFNPFQRASEGDVAVQVDRRIAATMHAWNVQNTDDTPTLARTLRLIYTVMIERDLGLREVSHLIDFGAKAFRARLVRQLETPLIEKEWRELDSLKMADWRYEVLSARNRLFKLLTSQTLTRIMGLPGRSINLTEVMDQGKILLVNLAPSDALSEDNARVFGALLVNEFFESARRRRGRRGSDPDPYFLYIDEFQEFVSLDISKMLDQVRKFGLFTILSHQRFGQLTDDLIDGLSNCRIKAVFGGLPVKWARYMAEEMFIGDLDPKRIKVAIYQTKFWPKYQRDKVYASSTSQSSSWATSQSTMSGSSSATAAGTFFQPADWFGADAAGTSTISTSAISQLSGTSSGTNEGFSSSESVADIPILLPVPFQELSSVQYYTLDEQLVELTAALKEQYPRHCFIKIQQQKTQPMLVPVVEEPYVTRENRAWYVSELYGRCNALAAAETDRLLKNREDALLKESDDTDDGPPVQRDGPRPNPDFPSRSRTAKTQKKEAADDILNENV